MGGWMAIAGYCSSGFKPLPSWTAVMEPSSDNILKGLTTKLFRIKKKVWTNISTPTT